MLISLFQSTPFQSAPFQTTVRLATGLAIVFAMSTARAQDASQAIGPPPGNLEAADGEPPLAPVVRWGEQGIEALKKVEDYTARLVKRERIRGRLERAEQLFLKIRHRPLSIYARFETTTGQVTQEILFVEGQNRNRMWVHSDHRKFLGTVSIYPWSRIALREGRYPLNQIGLLELTKQLVGHARKAIDVPGTQTQVYRDATIDGRPTIALAVTHDQPHKDLTYHHARVFIDRQWNVPVRYESYSFPRESGGPPRLLEQYTYLDLAFNVGLSDNDFDVHNPAYHFSVSESEQPEPSETIVEDPVAETSPETTEPVAEQPVVEQPLAKQPAAEPTAESTIAVDFAEHAAAANERLRLSPTYTCLVIRRRLADGQLNRGEFYRMKHRQQPAGVYLRGFWPPSTGQQRLLYAANQNHGQAVVRLADNATGVRIWPTELQKRLKDSRLITQLGIGALLSEAVATTTASKETAENPVTIRRYSNAQIDAHACVCFEITQPESSSDSEVYRRRIFFDKRRKIPIRFEMYAAPTKPSGPTQLIEDITYRSVVLGTRLAPQDFDALNPAYGFLAQPVAASFRQEP